MSRTLGGVGAGSSRLRLANDSDSDSPSLSAGPGVATLSERGEERLVLRLQGSRLVAAQRRRCRPVETQVPSHWHKRWRNQLFELLGLAQSSRLGRSRALRGATLHFPNQLIWSIVIFKTESRLSAVDVLDASDKNPTADKHTLTSPFRVSCPNAAIYCSRPVALAELNCFLTLKCYVGCAPWSVCDLGVSKCHSCLVWFG